MDLQTIQRSIQAKMALSSGLKARVKFALGDMGVVFVDTTQSPPVVEVRDLGNADVVLESTPEVMHGILQGTQDPNLAFLMGKLKIQGSMGLAMKLASILED